MSKLGAELNNLKASFAAVAAAMKEELPEICKDAEGVWENDESFTRFMCRPNAFLEGRRPVELAQESAAGRKAVHDYIMKIKYGVYP